MNTTIARNQGRSAGGGGIFSGTISGKTNVTITNTVIAENSARNGAGVYFGHDTAAGTIVVTNSTICNNTASLWGGGIYRSEQNGDQTTISNTIVALNTDDFGLWGTSLPGSDANFGGSHNLIGNGYGQTALVDGSDGNLVGTKSAPIDPLLGDWTQFDNGLWGYGLLPSSPALDAGDNALAVDADGRPLCCDIAGGTRIQNGTVDIGAYELETSSSLTGDLNGDGYVGSGDLDVIRANWGSDVLPGSLLDGDPSGDGIVNAADLDIVRANWENTLPTPAAVDAVFEGRADDTPVAVYGPARNEEAAGRNDRADLRLRAWWWEAAQEWNGARRRR